MLCFPGLRWSSCTAIWLNSVKWCAIPLNLLWQHPSNGDCNFSCSAAISSHPQSHCLFFQIIAAVTNSILVSDFRESSKNYFFNTHNVFNNHIILSYSAVSVAIVWVGVSPRHKYSKPLNKGHLRVLNATPTVNSLDVSIMKEHSISCGRLA